MDTYATWKEKAASAVTEDAKIEQAFMSQAYGFIQNKAGELASEPHRLGFEIVYKNDENTRMVGIFAFRAGERLYYTPVFFIEGEIKGTDLLYDVGRKMMMPLTPERTSFIIGKNSGASTEGEGVNRQSRAWDRGLNFRPIIKPASFEAWKSMLESVKEATAKYDNEHVLHDFIMEDGGKKAMDLLVNTMAENEALGCKIANSLPMDAYAPPNFAEKRASMLEQLAPRETGRLSIVAHGIPEGTELSDDEKQTLFKQGFVIKDTRENVSTVVVNDTQGVVEKGIQESGKYKLLTPQGIEPVVIFNGLDCAMQNEATTNDDQGYGSKQPLIIHMYSRDYLSYCRNDIPVINGSFEEQKDVIESFSETPQVGEFYFMVLKDGSEYKGPFKVVEKQETPDGLTELVIRRWSDHQIPQTLYYNPHIENKALDQSTILGNNTVFIRVAVEIKDRGLNDADLYQTQDVYKVTPGNDDDIRRWVLGETMGETVKLSQDLSGLYDVEIDDEKKAADLEPMGALVYLMNDLGVPAKEAQALMDSPKKEISFFLERSKQASYFVDSEEDYEDDYDNLLRVLAKPESMEYTVATEHQYPEKPQPHLLDAWNPASSDGLPKEVLQQSSQQQLMQLSSTPGFPNIFEHGLIGSLTNAFDAVGLVDKYIPKLEEACDVLGRTLFLYYWKPHDFQEAYGMDDMTDMEQELLSNFKTIGRLTLELKKKSNLLKETKSDRSPSLPE